LVGKNKRVVIASKRTLSRPLGFQEVEAPSISKQLAHEGGEVFNPMHRPPLPPGRYLWCSFLLQTESNIWL